MAKARNPLNKGHHNAAPNSFEGILHREAKGKRRFQCSFRNATSAMPPQPLCGDPRAPLRGARLEARGLGRVTPKVHVSRERYAPSLYGNVPIEMALHLRAPLPKRNRVWWCVRLA